MNYKESSKILAKIKASSKILLNCHRYPDPDSITSALGLYLVLKQMGKEPSIICPTPIRGTSLSYLPNLDKVSVVSYSAVDYSRYDLFIVTDSADWRPRISSVD